MSPDEPFHELLERVRHGDQDAATQLVRVYEPTIRRVVRLRMANSPLTAVLDSTDICQSVLASFFVRINLGQYTLDTPDQLVRLLATMARSKLAGQIRHEQAQRRDRRRSVSLAVSSEPAGVTATPSREIAAKELLSLVHRSLSQDEREIVKLRQQGDDWNSVAESMGGSPDALRMKLSRAIDRVARELGDDCGL